LGRSDRLISKTLKTVSYPCSNTIPLFSLQFICMKNQPFKIEASSRISDCRPISLPHQQDEIRQARGGRGHH